MSAESGGSAPVGLLVPTDPLADAGGDDGFDSLPVEGFFRCPRRLGHHWVSEATGAFRFPRCDANFCPYCAVVKGSMIARALARSAPERMVRFSLVPSHFRETRRAVNEVRRIVGREGLQWNFAYHVEPNPRGTGNHLHGWQHGSFVPQAFLQEACHRAGLGLPDIRRFRARSSGRGAGYGLKGISYGMKHEDLDEFLDLNGGRLVHHTRGFYRDGADGDSMSLGEIKRLMIDEHASEDEGPWLWVADEPVSA